MQIVGSSHDLSAQLDSTMGFSECTSRGAVALTASTSSTIAGMRGAAGGRESAATKPPCIA